MKRLVFLFISIVMTLSALEYEVSVTPNSGVVGDVFTYTLELTYPETESLVAIPDVSLFEAFEVNDKRLSKIQKDGSWHVSFSVDFQVFSLDEAIIPTHSISYKKWAVKKERIDAIVIPIVSTLDPDNPLAMEDIRPVSDIQLSKASLAKIIASIAAILSLLAVGVYSWRQRRAKQAPLDVSEEPRKSPKEIALEAMEALIQKDLIRKREYKLYYTELTEILKHYLTGVTSINVVDMTTEETVRKIDRYIDAQTVRRLKHVLDYSDLVKFAKYDASTDNHDEYLTKANEVITRIQRAI